MRLVRCRRSIGILVFDVPSVTAGLADQFHGHGVGTIRNRAHGMCQPDSSLTVWTLAIKGVVDAADGRDGITAHDG